MEKISFLVAFMAGSATFFSPCILPLIPAYLSYLSGISFREISGEAATERQRHIKTVTAVHSLSFIAGFSVVFVLLGAGTTYLGKLLFAHQAILKKISGIIIILFGILVTGIIKVPFLDKERKFSYRKKGVSILGSILVGATFAAAWTPCVGFILGSILAYAASAGTVKEGIKLLAAFSLGLGVPFFLSALIMNIFLVYVKKIEKYLRWINIIMGVVLILFGVILLRGRLL
jgi:cytochrome c-type biogenesis protein